MKKIEFDTKEKIVSAVTKLADAVGSTLGAGGRNVLFQVGKEFAITKDGVTVARQIEFEDEEENAVAQIVKDAAARTARDAGDGTTTSTIIAAEVIRKILNNGMFDSLNVTQIRRGIEAASKELIKAASKKKKMIETDEEIHHIATISGNNDTAIGDMMLDVYSKVGKEGAVRLEETQMNETLVRVVDGFHLEAGYINANFSNAAGRTAVYEKPFIFVTDKKFEAGFGEILKPLEAALSNNRPLLIVCGGMEGETLGTLVNNKVQKGLPVVAVQAPHFGNDRYDILDDLAAATGATMYSESRGFNLDEITVDHLGSADKVVVDELSTTIIGRSGEEEKIKERVDYIKSQQKEDRQGDMTWRLNQRLASLTSGVGVIYVGGNSEAEMRDMYFRLEDALAATKSAMSSGYVVGGGMAYFNAAREVKPYMGETESFVLGYASMLSAAQAPVAKIIQNAGYDPEEYLTKLGKKGFNAVTCELEDLEKSGIIDPYQVLESSISNAASVAAMLITTNVIITDERRRR